VKGIEGFHGENLIAELRHQRSDFDAVCQIRKTARQPPCAAIRLARKAKMAYCSKLTRPSLSEFCTSTAPRPGSAFNSEAICVALVAA